MRLNFLGGGDEVGGLACHMTNNGTRLLLDYGYHPAEPPRYPPPPPDFDQALLTHAHLDHSGTVAWLTGNDYKVISTPPTAKLAAFMAVDSLKIATFEGYSIPFDEEDVRLMEAGFLHTHYERKRVVEDLEVTLHSAGHIPGATMYQIDGEDRTLFTGDLNTIPMRLVNGAKPVKCDTLVIETTYAGRDHPPRRELEHDLRAKVEEVVDRHGRVIIPAFAMGRTQEMMMVLFDLGLEIWVDGMGTKLTKTMLEDPHYLADAHELARAETAINPVWSAKGRAMAQRGDVIITTSGMLHGGPVMTYLRAMGADKRNAVLLTGYQVPGTNGRTLMTDGYVVDEGETIKVDAEVEFFDFSAHAGHKELKDFIRGCAPQRLVLMHGDNREAMAEEFPTDPEVFLPVNGQPLDLDI